MKRITTLMALFISVMCYGQDKLPDKPKQDTSLVVVSNGVVLEDSLKEGVYVRRSGTVLGRKTYTEIYEVVTDSIVNRFGLEFRYDSTFVRRVHMDGINRKLWDRMNADIDFVLSNQERLRKETVEFLDRYRTSYEVWLYFKLLGIFGK